MYPNPSAGDWVKEDNLPWPHSMAVKFNMVPIRSDQVKPTKLTDPVPLFSELNQAIYLLPPVLIPFAARWLYYNYVSSNMPNSILTWFMLFYFTFQFAGRWSHFLKRLSIKYGFFNAGRARDMVPFSELPKVFKEVFGALIIRTGMAVFTSYDKHAAPCLSMWTPLQLFVFTVIEDFYYYWLHRFCHESPAAWKVHQLHHTTKAPNTLLSGYASDVQEAFDILIVPLMTWYTFPIPFDTFVVWILIHLAIQIQGHCGVRLHFGTLLTGPYLNPLGLELVVEDHDLHHRYGWRESYNYCKQSGIWDNLFGTKSERIEGFNENIDRSQFIY